MHSRKSARLIRAYDRFSIMPYRAWKKANRLTGSIKTLSPNYDAYVKRKELELSSLESHMKRRGIYRESPSTS